VPLLGCLRLLVIFLVTEWMTCPDLQNPCEAPKSWECGHKKPQNQYFFTNMSKQWVAIPAYPLQLRPLLVLHTFCSVWEGGAFWWVLDAGGGVLSPCLLGAFTFMGPIFSPLTRILFILFSLQVFTAHSLRHHGLWRVSVFPHDLWFGIPELSVHLFMLP